MKLLRKKLTLVFAVAFLLQIQAVVASANELVIAQDHQGTYSRSLFKHWIDEDRDGCNTRTEVLIEEAIVKPKIGKKCVLTGGKWRSPYDNKVTSKFSDLDIDHLVPLAEAWRSGAWAWTPTQRQAFANDLTESRALVAVSLGLNRSKGDKDVANWLPKVNTCQYFESWIIVKKKYGLTVDSLEAARLNFAIKECNLNSPLIGQATPNSTPTPVTPTPTPTPTITIDRGGNQAPGTFPGGSGASNTSIPAPSITPTASPTPSNSTSPSVTPGAFCSPSGATGNSASGVTYTCKTSPTDTRNRWRP